MREQVQGFPDLPEATLASFYKKQESVIYNFLDFQHCKCSLKIRNQDIISLIESE